MTSRISTEISQHKVNLDKIISEETQANAQERVTDLLNVLIEFPMTIEVLKETGIGQTLQDIKSKFNDSSIGALAKRVIAKWRKDCKTQEDNKKSSESVPSSDKPRGKEPLKASSNLMDQVKGESSLSRTKSYEEEDWNEDHYDKLNEIRRKVSVSKLLSNEYKQPFYPPLDHATIYRCN